MQSLVKERRDEEELMDLPSTSTPDFKRALQDIQWVNRNLGGTDAILSEVEPYLRKATSPLRILDLGTGSADIPLALAKLARSLQREVQITGLDFHETAVEVSKRTTSNYPEIDIVQGDALALTYSDQEFDLVISSMFMHHLKKEEAVHLLKEMARLSRLGFIINDLERHIVAYWTIKAIGWVTRKGHVFLNDAPLSVLRGFTRADLEELKQLSGLNKLSIQRRFPYRWIISLNHD